jgi:protein SCO1/2
MALLLATGLAGCTRKDPPKRYAMKGQVLGVDTAKRELTINHEDIPDLMPAMTMIYTVADAALMTGRTPGETITATLAVENSLATIVEITHVGTAPLPAGAALAAGVLDAGDEVPDAAFVDQANRRRSISEWKGTPVVLTFTYTRCPLPNFCPLMDQNFATLQRRLADDTALRGRVKLITVSFDPSHDTPQVLAAHAAKVKADPAIWSFLSGDAVTTERFAGKFGVTVMRDPKEAPDVAHNLRTAVIGADARVIKMYSGNEWTPGEILADLQKAVGK